MGVEVRTVRSRSDLREFIDFPYRLYSGNAQWVPPLRNSEFHSFSPSNNPAYKHCTVQLWIATTNGRTSGRIAGIINFNENQDSSHQWVRFGWFDFEDDMAISASLIEALYEWARNKGCTHVKGPYGFSNTDKAGILTYGYNELPTILESYNYPYYPVHVEDLGFDKLVDYKSFEAQVPEEVPQRVSSITNLILKRYQLSRVKIQSKKDVANIGFEVFNLLNIVYADLEGFIPHSPEQIKKLVKEYSRLVNPDFLSVVRSRSGAIAAFGVTMPSYSTALQKCKGKLYPFGFLKVRQAVKRNDRADLNLIGVHPDYKQKGLTAIIFEDIIQAFISHGIKKVETNPEIESNQQVQNLWKDYQIRHHKTRRCYQKNL